MDRCLETYSFFGSLAGGKPRASEGGITCKCLEVAIRPLYPPYEDPGTFAINYLSSGAIDYLQPGDPIRNIRWSFISGASPQLSYPGMDGTASWENGTDPPVDLCQIQFFVNRKGEVILIGTDGYELVVQGLIFDALRRL